MRGYRAKSSINEHKQGKQIAEEFLKLEKAFNDLQKENEELKKENQELKDKLK